MTVITGCSSQNWIVAIVSAPVHILFSLTAGFLAEGVTSEVATAFQQECEAQFLQLPFLNTNHDHLSPADILAFTFSVVNVAFTALTILPPLRAATTTLSIVPSFRFQ